MADGTDNTAQPTSPTPTPAVMASASAPANLQTSNPSPTDTIQQQSPTDMPTPSAGNGLTRLDDYDKGVKGFLQKTGNFIVQTGGQPTPEYDVDAQTGKLTEVARNATPGTLFKNLLVGALTGLGASAQTRGRGGWGAAAGAGFTAAMGAAQTQDDHAREQAIKQAQLKQQAQKANDEHDAAGMEKARNGLAIAQLNAQNYMVTKQVLQMGREQVDAYVKQTKEDMDDKQQNAGYTPVQSNLNEADALKLQQNEQSLGHRAIFGAVGWMDVKDSNGNPVMEDVQVPDGVDKNGHVTEKTVQRPKQELSFTVLEAPQDVTLTPHMIQRFQDAGVLSGGQIKPNQVVSGEWYHSKLAQLQKQDLQDLTVEDKKTEIAKNQAEASEAQDRAKDLLDDMHDKEQAKTATSDYGDALTMVNNDPTRVGDVLSLMTGNRVAGSTVSDTDIKNYQKAHPNAQKSIQALSSSEAADFAKNGEVTKTDENGTTTTVKRQRLFTAQTAPKLSEPQLAQVKTLATNLVGKGQSRDQVNAQVKQAFPNDAAGIMQWLDNQGVFKAQPQRSVWDKKKVQPIKDVANTAGSILTSLPSIQ